MCQIISQFDFFKDLSVALQGRVARQVQLREVRGGDFLIKQGAFDDEGFFMVLAGACHVYNNLSYKPESDDTPPWDVIEQEMAAGLKQNMKRRHTKSEDPYERKGYGKKGGAVLVGNCFGEMSLAGSKPSRRGASVVAATDVVQLLQIPGKVFKECLKNYAELRHFTPAYITEILNTPKPQRSRRMVSAMVDFLKNSTDFVKGFPPGVWKHLAKAMQLELLPNRKVIFRQGQTGKKFYIILSGKVGVYLRDGAHSAANARGADEDLKRIFGALDDATSDGEPIEVDFLTRDHELESGSWVSILRDGDTFGERAIIDNSSTRKATCFTCGTTELLTLTADEYLRALATQQRRSPQAGVLNLDRARIKSLIDTPLEKRTSDDLATLAIWGQTNVAFFQQLAEAERLELVKSIRVRSFKRGDIIYKQGDVFTKSSDDEPSDTIRRAHTTSSASAMKVAKKKQKGSAGESEGGIGGEGEGGEDAVFFAIADGACSVFRTLGTLEPAAEERTIKNMTRKIMSMNVAMRGMTPPDGSPSSRQGTPGTPGRANDVWGNVLQGVRNDQPGQTPVRRVKTHDHGGGHGGGWKGLQISTTSHGHGHSSTSPTHEDIRRQISQAASGRGGDSPRRLGGEAANCIIVEEKSSGGI